jgi:hypothetical protein
MGVIGAAMTSVLAAALAAPADPVDVPAALPTNIDVPAEAPAEPPIQLLGPPTENPYVARALAEGAVAFGLSVLWYYRNPSLSVKDIDYNWSLETWRKRLITGQAIRFDDNAFSINTVLHPSSGVVLYLIARGNRLGPVASFVLVTAASVLWEFLVEYREVASINDLTITSMAGVSIGEPLIRTAALLRSTGEAAGPVNRVVAAIFDPIGAFNRALDPEISENVPADRYGLPLVYRHRLSLSAGLAYTHFEGDRVRDEAQLLSELFVDTTSALPSPGRRSQVVGPGSLTYLVFEGNVAEAQVSGARLASTLAVVGRSMQVAQGPDEVSVTRADDLFLGLASGFEYAFRARPNLTDDDIGIARLLGPLFDWGLHRGGLELHLAADLSYDFALVHALALTDYEASAGTAALPRVLWQHQYYYAQGLSASMRLWLRYGRWEAGADGWEDDFWFLRGRDRFLPAVPEPPAFDRRALRRVWFSARFSSRLPFKVSLVGDQVTREGTLGGAHSRLWELRTAAMLGIGF